MKEQERPEESLCSGVFSLVGLELSSQCEWGVYRRRKVREVAEVSVGHSEWQTQTQVSLTSNPPAPYNQWPQVAKIFCSMISETIFSLILCCLEFSPVLWADYLEEAGIPGPLYSYPAPWWRREVFAITGESRGCPVHGWLCTCTHNIAYMLKIRIMVRWRVKMFIMALHYWKITPNLNVQQEEIGKIIHGMSTLCSH